MARATQTVKKTTVRIKSKAQPGRMKCNVCGGTGYQKRPKRKAK